MLWHRLHPWLWFSGSRLNTAKRMPTVRFRRFVRLLGKGQTYFQLWCHNREVTVLMSNKVTCNLHLVLTTSGGISIMLETTSYHLHHWTDTPHWSNMCVKNLPTVGSPQYWNFILLPYILQQFFIFYFEVIVPLMCGSDFFVLRFILYTLFRIWLVIFFFQ